MNITHSAIDSIAVFGLDGPLDSRTSGQVQSALLSAIQGGSHRLVVDFDRVDYVSSAGLRVILMVAKQARAAGGDIAVFGLNNPVRETFEISGFNRILSIVGLQKEALEAVGRGPTESRA